MRNYKDVAGFEGGLQFGNLTQIAYLHAMEVEASIAEERTKEGLKSFDVEIIIEGTYNTTVWAISDEDARALAQEEFDMDGCEFDETDYSYNVTERVEG